MVVAFEPYPVDRIQLSRSAPVDRARAKSNANFDVDDFRPVCMRCQGTGNRRLQSKAGKGCTDIGCASIGFLQNR